jgi:acyl-CoA thioester hydrolase
MMDGYSFVHREPVRFRDLDGMAHVNNAVFSTYLEQARLAWFGDADPQPLEDVILARTEIDFRSPVRFGEIVEIGVRPARIGTKSFELEYEVQADGRVVASAKSVLVGYDYERAQSIPIPERWRRRLTGE